MSERSQWDKKYFIFAVLFSMFLVTSTITITVFTPTSADDNNTYEKLSNPKGYKISLVNTTLKLLVNNTRVLSGEIFSVVIGEPLNITVFFSDNNSIPLNGATINITKGGFTSTD
jgi:hypothetical protein